MLTPNRSLKKITSVAFLCATLFVQQPKVRAWEVPAQITEHQVRISVAALAATPFLDALIKNRNELATWAGLKRIFSILNSHMGQNLMAKAIGERNEDETLLAYTQRFISTYAQNNPTFTLALALVAANTTRAGICWSLREEKTPAPADPSKTPPASPGATPPANPLTDPAGTPPPAPVPAPLPAGATPLPAAPLGRTLPTPVPTPTDPKAAGKPGAARTEASSRTGGLAAAAKRPGPQGSLATARTLKSPATGWLAAAANKPGPQAPNLADALIDGAQATATPAIKAGLKAGGMQSRDADALLGGTNRVIDALQSGDGSALGEALGKALGEALVEGTEELLGSLDAKDSLNATD